MSTDPYRISAAGNAGRGLFATRSLSPGDVIFTLDRPLLTALDTAALDYACEWCFDGVGEAALGPRASDDGGPQELKLLRCSGCKLVKYCNKTCQAQAWKHHHKLECKVFGALMPRVLPHAPRMLLQLLFRRRKGVISDDEWKRFMELKSHVEEFHRRAGAGPDGNDIQKLQLAAMATKQYSGGTEPVPYFQELVAKVYINTQTLVSPIFHPLGLCLDPLPASINHSCASNAVVVFNGPTMTLRAISPIAEGEEITISYIDSTSPVEQRQEELSSRYFFKCRCRDCEAGYSFGQPAIPPAISKNPDALKALLALDKLATSYSSAALKALQDGGPGGLSESGSAEDAYYTSLCQGLACYLSQGSSALWDEGAGAYAYPAGRQPLAKLRQDATIELLARGHFLPALILSLAGYYESDPAHFPYAAHPVRVVRVYVLSKLAGQVGFVVMQNLDADCVEFARAFDMDGGRRPQQGSAPITTWPEVSMALLGEAAACVQRGHTAGGRLDEQIQAEVRAAATSKLVSREAALLMSNQSVGPDMGIRDVRRWRALRRVAVEGWDWYVRYVREKSAGRELDPGLKILTAERGGRTGAGGAVIKI